MSNNVVEEVARFTFDNAQFHKGIEESIKDLDVLKKALNVDEITKSLQTIEQSTSKISFSGFSGSIKTAIDDSIGHITKLAIKITSIGDAFDMVKSKAEGFLNSFKIIESAKSGFEEYNLQLDSVQTILANTADAGKTVTDVNQALGELNEYADKTIYNFSQMTQNIGRFTAAGVGLEDSVAAIKGISNLAAISGAKSEEASRAMYQLSQAMASGTLMAQDWMSVVNASMGGKQFQDQLLETARVHGIAVDEMIEKNGSFKLSLQEGWLSSEILLETLKKYTGDMTAEEMEALGYTEEQIEYITGDNGLAKRAYDAATEIKTIPQLFDTIAESRGSGWSQTWQILIGDFEQAKDLLTEIYNVWDAIVQEGADARNSFLSEVMDGKNFRNVDQTMWETFAGKSEYADELKDAIIEVARVHGIAIDEMIEAEGSFENTLDNGWLSTELIDEALNSADTEQLAHTYEDLQRVVDEVINGDWGNGEERMQRLTEAGYDYAAVQGLVNEMVYNGAIDWENMSDEQLASLGYTEEQIEHFKELKEQLGDSDSAISELMGDTDQLTGREMILESIRNVLVIIQKVIGEVKDAWARVFPPASADNVKNIIEQIMNFTKSIADNEELIMDIGTIFEGLFSAIKIGVDIVSIAADVFGALMESLFPKDDNRTKKTNDFIETLLSISVGIIRFKDGLEEFKNSFDFSNMTLPEIFQAISDWFAERGITVEEMSNRIGFALDAFGQRAKAAFEKAKEWLTGKGIDLSFLDKFKDWFSAITDRFKELDFSKITNFFKSLKDNLTSKLGSGVASLGGLFDTIREAVSGKLSAGLQKITEFFSGKSFDFSWFTNIKSKISDTLSGLTFEDFHPIQAIKDATQPIIDWFMSLGDSVGGIGEVIGSVFSDIAAVFSGDDGVLAELGAMFGDLDDTLGESSTASLKDGVKGLGEIAGPIGDFFSSVGDSLSHFVGDLQLSDILKWFRDMFITLTTFKAVGTLKNLGKGLESLSQIGASFQGAADAIKTGLSALGGGFAEGKKSEAAGKVAGNVEKQFRPLESIGTLILKIGASFALVGVGLKFIASALDQMADVIQKFGSMDQDTINRGIVTVGLIEGLLAGLVLALSKINSGTGVVKEVVDALVLGMIVDVLGDVSEIVIKLGTVDADLERGLSILGGIELLLGTFTICMTELMRNQSAIQGVVDAAILKAMVSVVGDFAELVIGLSKDEALQDEGKIEKAVGVVTVSEGLLVAFVGVLKAVSKDKDVVSEVVSAATLPIIVMALDAYFTSITKLASLTDGQYARMDEACEIVAISEALLAAFVSVLKLVDNDKDVVADAVSAATLGFIVQALDDYFTSITRLASLTDGQYSRMDEACSIAAISETLLAAFISVLKLVDNDKSVISDIVGAGTLSLIVQTLGDYFEIITKLASLTNGQYDHIDEALGIVTASEVLLGTFAGVLLHITNSGVGGGWLNSIAGGASLFLMAGAIDQFTETILKFTNITATEDQIISAVGIVAASEVLLGTFAFALLKVTSGTDGLDSVLIGAGLELMASAIDQLATVVIKLADGDLDETRIQNAMNTLAGIEFLLGTFAIVIDKVASSSLALEGLGIDLIADGLSTLIDAVIRLGTTEDFEVDSDMIEGLAIAIGSLAAVAAISAIRPVQTGLIVLAGAIAVVGFVASLIINAIANLIDALTRMHDSFKDSEDPTGEMIEWLSAFETWFSENAGDLGKACGDFASNFITGLVSSFVAKADEILQIGGDIATIIGTGLNTLVDECMTSIGSFVKWFGDTLLEFFNAPSEWHDIFDTFCDLFIALFSDDPTALEEAAHNFVSAIMRGFVKSLQENETIRAIWDGIASFVNSINDALDNGIHMATSDEFVIETDGSVTIHPKTIYSDVEPSDVGDAIGDALAGTKQVVTLPGGQNFIVEVNSDDIQYVYKSDENTQSDKRFDFMGNLVEETTWDSPIPMTFNPDVDVSAESIEQSGIEISDALAEAIRAGDTEGAISQAAEELGGNAMAGLTNGATAHSGEFTETFSGEVEDGLTEGETTAEVNSPSKRTHRLGGFIIEGLINGINERASTLATAMRTILDNLINGINSYLDKFNKAGLDLMTSLNTGFESGTHLVTETIDELMQSIADTIAKNSDLHDVGTQIPQGLANGINEGASVAISAASQMARDTLNAAKNELQIESPSRKFANEVGKYIPAGTALGVLQNMKYLDDAMDQMGVKAVDDTLGVLQTMNNVIDDELEFNPVISPVVDLTNINRANGMMASSFGIRSGSLAYTNAIHASSSSNPWSGMVDELADKLSSSGGDTYVIMDGAVLNDDEAMRAVTLDFLYGLKRKAAL